VDVIDGERFHREGRPFYQAPVGDEGPGWATVKRAGGMARVAEEPNHPNPAESGSRAGLGRGVWYVLDGTLTVTIVAPGGTEATAELRPGDLCATRLGQAHTGVAGAAGARVLVIDVAV
jgi:hypothetical protein